MPRYSNRKQYSDRPNPIDRVKSLYVKHCAICNRPASQAELYQYGESRRCMDCVPEDDRHAVLDGTYTPPPKVIPKAFGGWS